MSQKLPIDSLAYALLGAAQAGLAVRNGQALPDALKNLFAQQSINTRRGAIQDLAYRSMRERAWADAVIAQLTDHRVLAPALLHELLVVASVLLKATARDASQAAPYPGFVVVDQSVSAAKAIPALKRASSLINGLLRSLLRVLENSPSTRFTFDLAAQWNHPAWWIEQLQQAYPKDWENLLTINNQRPPLVLRVNTAQTQRAEVLGELKAAGIGARGLGEQFAAQAIRLDVALAVEKIPGFLQGRVSVQDEAAQRAAPLLDVRDGMRVLDACAAPGGKTCHLLELADIDLWALDCQAERLTRVRENLQRVHAQKLSKVRLLVGDATQPADWWDGQLFDRILADVPCTASGIVRRHADIRWLRRAQDIETLAATQKRILDALWKLLAPGGKLLYVTCSIFPQESADQAHAFVQRHSDARRLSAPGQLLPTANETLDHDGLFFALFEKLL